MISISLPVAYIGGILTAFLPCTLPVIIGYIGLLTASGTKSRYKTILSFILFTLGFSLTYAVLGFLAGFVGGSLFAFIPLVRDLFFIVTGAFFFFLAALMFRIIDMPDFSAIGGKRWNIMNVGSPIAGILFAIAWTPCIGPVLGAALTIAAGSQNAIFGMLLIFVFSLGIMTPFIPLVIFKEHVLSFISRYPVLLRGVEIIFGLFFLIFGYFFAAGFPSWISTTTFSFLDNLQYSLF